MVPAQGWHRTVTSKPGPIATPDRRSIASLTGRTSEDGERRLGKRHGPHAVPVLFARPVRAKRPVFASDIPIDTALRDIGRSGLAHFIGNMQAVSAETPEAVHQMRVALRRLRSILAAFKPNIATAQYRLANNQLKLLSGTLETPRNWDVLAEEILLPVCNAVPGDENLRRLVAMVESERQAAYRKLGEDIGTSACRATVLSLGHWFETHAWRESGSAEQAAWFARPVGEVARILVARSHRKAKQRSRNFGTLSPPERHELRIALKRLRYTIEFLASQFDVGAADFYLKRLSLLLNDLGYANDVRTARIVLRELADSTDDGAIRRAVTLVLDWHKHNRASRETGSYKHMRRFRQAKIFW